MTVKAPTVNINFIQQDEDESELMKSKLKKQINTFHLDIILMLTLINASESTSSSAPVFNLTFNNKFMLVLVELIGQRAQVVLLGIIICFLMNLFIMSFLPVMVKHIQWYYEDHALLDDGAHAAFFKEHGAWWTELAYLSYFDLIPIVWQTFIDKSNKDFESARKRYLKAQEKFNMDFMAWKHDEPANLLHLSTALKIFCGSSVQLDLLPQAEALLQEYLLEFKWHAPLDVWQRVNEAVGNFHWSVHLVQQINDYGPVYNFWVFLSE
ncbi:uncharacterized protein F5891DRAFT_977515 [Suillus fuscotomentosus]|uniref:Uncharacterized protein n=1 Tax=Suillus fuscotomentosus TaxID=1912939 RepID=A0AAD4HQP2_9AGAM|nr:uncharacterized protein F5891DRAFT_977515 [Suillus fuscotomentosus]KAG1904004.1 hypothetical protein F5891DRAFT_977515 [Suillus fuscotomentosus]